MTPGFEYEVITCFDIPESDVDRLIILSGAHYDSTCKAAGRPGPSGFLHGMKNSAEGGKARGRLTVRELSLACKILELPVAPARLRRAFSGLLGAAIAESKRVNAHTV